MEIIGTAIQKNLNQKILTLLIILVLDSFMKRANMIKMAGYNLISIWEYDYKKSLYDNTI